MKKNIGKNTIGDNNKMSVDLKTYNRSTHDLSYVWRNTQAVGTLVPFMNEVGLPGDTWEIELNANVMTHPTVGPLFGTFKLQNHIYSTPMRLYNSWLHNNRAKIGLNMSQIKLPQLRVILNNTTDKPTKDNEWTQVNPSCLLAYLGIRGFGYAKGDESPASKNAVSLLGYYDIVKNYYANLQEDRIVTIVGSAALKNVDIDSIMQPSPKDINKVVTAGSQITVYPATAAEINNIIAKVRPSTNKGKIITVKLSDIGAAVFYEATNSITYTLEKEKFPDPLNDLFIYSIEKKKQHS